MNYEIDTDLKTKSTFISEEYFPAIIEFSSEELNNHFIEFNYKDTDMFELSVHPKTHALKRFSLTLCNHYEFSEALLESPVCDEGTLYITGPDSTECSTFDATVYKNGMRIVLSDVAADKYIKSGNLVFALTDKNEVVSVSLIDLSEQEISHIKSELNQ